MTQMPSVPELQQALSGVPPQAWAARMDRRVRAARSAGLTSIEIPECVEAGVLVWRADLSSGAASLVAWGAANPTRRRWVLRIRRWTGTTVFARGVGVGTLGEHRWGEITAVVLGAIVGLFAGGWSVGGLVSVVCGALAGAAAAWAVWWLLLIAARTRIAGRPVNVADPEVMALVVSLAETGRRAAGLDFPDPSLDVGWTVKELTYQIVDQALGDEEFARLRYQGQLLGHAVGQGLRAQSNVHAVTEVQPVCVTSSAAAAAAADRAAATTARLTAHAAAVDEVADQLRGIRRSWSANL